MAGLLLRFERRRLRKLADFGRDESRPNDGPEHPAGRMLYKQLQARQLETARQRSGPTRNKNFHVQWSQDDS